MVGKRLKVLWRPEAGPTGLEAGLGGGAGPTGLEEGLVGRTGLAAAVETAGEAGPVELEVWPVRRQGYSWLIQPSPGSLFLPRLRGAHFYRSAAPLALL